METRLTDEEVPAPPPKKPPVKVGKRATAAAPGKLKQRAHASKT